MRPSTSSLSAAVADRIDDPPDEILVSAALDGDRDAFDDLVSRHRRTALRTAVFIVGPDRGEDVVQDALMFAFRALSTLRDRTKFLRWLLTITRYRALRVGRNESERRAGTVPLDGMLLETLSDLACAPREDRHGDDLLRSAIEKIPPGHAEVIRLHFLHGIPHQRIADLLGVKLSAVKWRCSRGKELIREILRPRSLVMTRLETGCADCTSCRREGPTVICEQHVGSAPEFLGKRERASRWSGE